MFMLNNVFQKDQHKYAGAKTALKMLAILIPVSMSPTFYEQLLCQYSFTEKLQSQTVGRKKLSKTLLYKKAAHKLLVNLTHRCEFHQHFMQKFCPGIFAPKNRKAKM